MPFHFDCAFRVDTVTISTLHAFRTWNDKSVNAKCVLSLLYPLIMFDTQGILFIQLLGWWKHLRLCEINTNICGEWCSGENIGIPTNEERVGILVLTSYVDRVWCWFSPLPREVFSGFSGFSLLKPRLLNSNSTCNARTLFKEFLITPKCSADKQITDYNE